MTRGTQSDRVPEGSSPDPAPDRIGRATLPRYLRLPHRESPTPVAVCLESLLFPCYVIVGQIRRHRQIKHDVHGCSDRFTFQLGNGFGNHLAVEVIANCSNMAGLALAEQVSGASNLQIAAWRYETRTRALLLRRWF